MHHTAPNQQVGNNNDNDTATQAGDGKRAMKSHPERKPKPVPHLSLSARVLCLSLWRRQQWQQWLFAFANACCVLMSGVFAENKRQWDMACQPGSSSNPNTTQTECQQSPFCALSVADLVLCLLLVLHCVHITICPICVVIIVIISIWHLVAVSVFISALSILSVVSAVQLLVNESLESVLCHAAHSEAAHRERERV